MAERLGWLCEDVSQDELDRAPLGEAQRGTKGRIGRLRTDSNGGLPAVATP